MNTLLDLVYVKYFNQEKNFLCLFVLDLNQNQFQLIYKQMKIIQRYHLFNMIYDQIIFISRHKYLQKYYLNPLPPSPMFFSSY
jgi:hypothetical protein